MFTIQAHDETWGTPNLVGQATASTFADAKAFICHSLDSHVKMLTKHNRPTRVTTTEEVPGSLFQVVLEWSPDGELAHPDADGWDMSPGLGLQCSVVITAMAGDAE